MRKLISLAEARVRFIRAHDPALAEKAASLKGVLEAKDVLLQEPPSEPDPVVRRAQGHARALANTKLLEAFDDAVRAYRIRLWGTLDRSKPATWLDELEQQIGKMEVLENTMTCDGRVWLDLRADEDEIDQEIARLAGTAPAQEVPDVSPPLPEGEAVPVGSAVESLAELATPEPEAQSETPPLPAAEPAVADPAQATPEPVTSAESPAASPEVNPGGRPTDRDRIQAEARRRLDVKENVPRNLAPFARQLRGWLEKQSNPERNSKGEVSSKDTIEEHVRDMFWDFWGKLKK
jgi:hypothetical protein